MVWGKGENMENYGKAGKAGKEWQGMARNGKEFAV
jgi:hypothetical protein